jgi:hypothetical protein
MFKSNIITTLFLLVSFSAFSQPQGMLFMEMTSAAPFKAQKSTVMQKSSAELEEDLKLGESMIHTEENHAETMERGEAMRLEDVEVAKSIDNAPEQAELPELEVTDLQVVQEKEVLDGVYRLPNRHLDKKVKEGVDEYARAKVEEMKPKAIKKMASNGVFKVDAWKDFGYTFKNESMDTLHINFAISVYERWSFSDYGITYAAGGVEQKSANNLRYGHAVGALTAVKENGKFRYMGLDGKMNFVILPGETIKFVMNDAKGSYSDNAGSVIVKWNLQQ